MPNPTTIGTWLAWAKTQIAPIDAEIIATYNFAPEGADRSWLVAHSEEPLPTDFTNPFNLANDMVSERRKGVPIAYLIGRRQFYGRDFDLTRDVLIPRVESEAIIDLAKTLDLPRTPRILDVGTGSGCLAVTLALEFPQAEVFASDISPEALVIAKHNDFRHEGRVKFACNNLLSDFDPTEHGHLDLIVANLPYVNPDWDWLDKSALSFEPATALYPEQGNSENGLSAYHQLFDQLTDITNDLGTPPTDYLILEADPCQHDELIALATSYGWTHHATQGYALAFRPTPVN